jgi:Fe-S cluster biogenesis protein NfuA
MHTPDRWLIIKTEYQGLTTHKIFGSWYSSYLDGAAWRLNSGITEIEDKELYYIFHGESGSCYGCSKSRYGTSAYGQSIINGFMNDLKDVDCVFEVMDEEEANKYIENMLNKNKE